MPTSRWTRAAIATLPMRACARAPSAMLTTSTPPRLQHLRGGERFVEVEADGRVHLDGDDELPARDLLRRARCARANGERRAAPATLRRIGGPRLERVAARIASPSSAAALPRSRRRAMRAAAAMRFTCSGRRAAAAADELHAELEHAARVDAEVLGRRHVDEALVDAAREPGVGQRPRPAGPSEHRAATASRTCIGPSQQLTPTTLAPHSFIEAADVGGDRCRRPCGLCSSTEHDAMTGTLPAAAVGALDGDAELLGLTERLDERARRRRPRRAPAPARGARARTFARSSALASPRK